MKHGSIKTPNPDKIKKAAKESPNSQSNGSMMRITPMAVFCHKMKIDGTLPEEDLKSSEDQHKE